MAAPPDSFVLRVDILSASDLRLVQETSCGCFGAMQVCVCGLLRFPLGFGACSDILFEIPKCINYFVEYSGDLCPVMRAIS